MREGEERGGRREGHIDHSVREQLGDGQQGKQAGGQLGCQRAREDVLEPGQEKEL